MAKLEPSQCLQHCFRTSTHETNSTLTTYSPRRCSTREPYAVKKTATEHHDSLPNRSTILSIAGIVCLTFSSFPVLRTSANLPKHQRGGWLKSTRSPRTTVPSLPGTRYLSLFLTP